MFRLKAPTVTLFNLRTPTKNTTSFTPWPPAPQTPFMDPSIWSKLPDHILDRILSFLPLKTFLSLRSTCKHFRTLIFSPTFLSRHPAPAFTPFLLLSHPQSASTFHLYDPRLDAWRNLPIPCASDSRSLLASSNGLLCSSLVHSSSSIFVVNLLTGSSRTIEAPIYPLDLDHFTLIATSSGYKIFTLCSSSSASRAYVYDSVDGSWTRFQGPDPILADGFHQDGVFYKGSLYFTSPDPFSVLGFDLQSGKWETRVEGNIGLPNNLTFARLASDLEDDGNLYLVGGVGQNGISRSVKVWRLCERIEAWVEVDELPDAFCRKLMSVCYHKYEHLYCLWHEGLVCVCCYTWPEILCYVVARRTWHWLPRCPSLPDKCSCGFKWFSFLPHLYVSA